VRSLGYDMSMGTGIYSAAPQWARIGVIMVMGSWHDALAADQLPREIVGNWCVAIERMLPGKTIPIGAAKTATGTSSCAGTAGVSPLVLSNWYF